jgi:hypothetical protein
MNQNIDKLLIQGVFLSFLSVLTQKRHYLLPLPRVLNFAMSIFDFIFDHYQLIEKPNFAAWIDKERKLISPEWKTFWKETCFVRIHRDDHSFSTNNYRFVDNRQSKLRTAFQSRMKLECHLVLLYLQCWLLLCCTYCRTRY